jgi:hypothetical protein
MVWSIDGISDGSGGHTKAKLERKAKSEVLLFDGSIPAIADLKSDIIAHLCHHIMHPLDWTFPK